MAPLDFKEGDYPPEIIGYAEPWIVGPGDSVAIKVRYVCLLLKTLRSLSHSEFFTRAEWREKRGRQSV